MKRSGLLAVAALVVALGATACAGSPSGTTDGNPPAATASGAVEASGKVSANTASEADLERAFEDAGIDNAAQWAEEVVEYRPYPADDATFAKLRQELAKYNPPADTVDRIVAVLTP